MSDLIDRQAALSFPFANGQYDHENTNEHFIFGCETYREWLEELPSAEPSLQDWQKIVLRTLISERKTAKWIEDKGQQTLMKNFIERGEVWRVCSVCGAGLMIGHKYACDKAYHDMHHNYCPNCGARMEVTE